MPFYPNTPAPTLRGLFSGIRRACFFSPFSGSWNYIDIDADLRGPIGDTVRTYSFEIYYPPENPADTVVLSGYPIFEQRYLCMDYDGEFNNELHFGSVSREITFSPPDTLPCDYPNWKILASETWQYAHADGNGETNPVTVIYPRYGYKTFPQWPGAGAVPYSLDIKYRRRGLLSDEQEEFIEPVVFEHTYREIEEIIANITVLKDSSELAGYWNGRRKQSCNEASFNFSFSVFPLPFNEQATITVTIPENDFLTIDIYDLSGKLVKRLFSGSVSSGKSNFRWDCVDSDGNKVSNGIYFARAVYQGKSILTKLILAR